MDGRIEEQMDRRMVGAGRGCSDSLGVIVNRRSGWINGWMDG